MFNMNWNKKIETKNFDQKQTFPKPKVIVEKVLGKPMPVGPVKKVETLSQPIEEPKRKISKELYGKIERRNMAILRFILDQKYISKEQLKRRFFSWANEKGNLFTESAVKRFLAEEWVSEKPGTGKHPALLIVTDKGLEKLTQMSQSEKRSAIMTKRIFEPEVAHDLILNDVRISMENKKMVSLWFSEKRLEAEPKMRSLFKDMPDAVVYSASKRGSFLEFENAPKGPGKYKERIEELTKALSDPEIINQGIDEIVFVCRESSSFLMLEKLIQNVKNVRLMKLTEVLG